jgi:hypothetical protein
MYTLVFTESQLLQLIANLANELENYGDSAPPDLYANFNKAVLTYGVTKKMPTTLSEKFSILNGLK